MTFICVLHLNTGTKGGDQKGNSQNGTGNEVEEIPFTETRFYVPSSYSAGPAPERDSMQSSSSYMSTLNVIVIIFFVLLSTGLVIGGS